MDVTAETFEQEVVERSKELPVVVDFWAEWCAPCKALTPVLVEAVAEREGVTLAKVDVDANPTLATEYRVGGIPAVKAFRNGHVVAEFTGARSARFVADFLDGLLGPSEAERLVVELREQGELLAAADAIEAGDYERAFEALLEELDGAPPERRDLVRRVMVALFGDLGQDHPLATTYRRRLATALY